MCYYVLHLNDIKYIEQNAGFVVKIQDIWKTLFILLAIDDTEIKT